MNVPITDVDECVSGPCQNGGSCVDGVDSYECNCSDGWAGENCETSNYTPQQFSFDILSFSDEICQDVVSINFYSQMSMIVFLILAKMERLVPMELRHIPVNV